MNYHQQYIRLRANAASLWRTVLENVPTLAHWQQGSASRARRGTIASGLALLLLVLLFVPLVSLAQEPTGGDATAPGTADNQADTPADTKAGTQADTPATNSAQAGHASSSHEAPVSGVQGKGQPETLTAAQATAVHNKEFRAAYEALLERDYYSAQLHFDTFLSQNPKSPVAPLATELLVQALAAMEAYSETGYYISNLGSTFPKSPEYKRLVAWEKEQELPRLSLDVAHSYAPGHEPVIGLDMRNVATVDFEVRTFDLLANLKACGDLTAVLQVFCPDFKPLATGAGAPQGNAVGFTSAVADKLRSSSKVVRQWRHYGASDASDLKIHRESVTIPVTNPGAYVVVAKNAAGKAHCVSLLILSNLETVYTPSRGGGGTLWVTNSATGAALQPDAVTLARNPVGRASITPSPSIVTLRASSRGLIDIPATVSGDFTCLITSGQQQALYHHSQLPALASEFRGHVFFDKPRYSAQDTVRWRAVIRDRSRSGYTLPSEHGVSVRVLDPLGHSVNTREASYNNAGVLRGDFAIPTPSVPGRWTLEILDDDNRICAEPFVVTKTGQNELRLALSLNKDSYLLTDQAECSAVVTDASGTPVPGAQVVLTCQARPQAFERRPVPKMPWFALTSPSSDASLLVDACASMLSLQRHDNAYTYELSGTADSSGRVVFRIPVNACLGFHLATTEHFVVNVEAVASVKGQKVGLGSTGFVAGAVATKLVLSVPAVVEVGKECDIIVQAQDLLGSPKQTALAAVVIDEYEVKDLGKSKTDIHGEAHFLWKPEYEGTYRLQIAADATKGRRARQEVIVNVVPAQVPGLSLKTEKAVYSTGDVVKVGFHVPNGMGSLLFTAESPVDIARFVVTPGKSDFEISLPIVKGAFSSLLLRAEGYREGKLQRVEKRLLVLASDEILTVEATPMAAPLPGQAGKVRITVTDQNKRPVAADVMVGLGTPSAYVDSRRGTWTSLLTSFYGSEVAPADSALPRDRYWGCNLLPGLASATCYKFANGAAVEGGLSGSASAVAGSVSSTSALDMLAPAGNGHDYSVACWVGDARSNERGVADVAVTWPDTAGQWRLNCVALTGAGQMGQAVTTVDVRSSVAVSIQSPPVLMCGPVHGDTVASIVTLKNETAGQLKVSLQAKSSRDKVVRLLAAGTAVGTSKTTLTVPGGQTVKWPVMVEAVSAGKAELVVDYDIEGTMGSCHYPMVVNAWETPSSVARTVKVSKSRTLDLAPVALAGKKVTNRGLEVELVTGISGAACSACRALSNCGHAAEEVVSSCVPHALTLTALKYHGLPMPHFEQDMSARVDSAIVELMELQKSDGGFAWRPELDSDPMVTAFVLSGLQGLRFTGYTKCDPILKRACSYLLRCEPTLPLEERCFALLALSKSGSVPPRSLSAVMEKRQQLDAIGLCQLAELLHNVNQRDKAISILMSAKSRIHSTKDSGQMYFSGNAQWSDVEATSFALNAFVVVAPKHPVVASCLDWLLTQRSVGGWSSVRESALATETLAACLLKNGETTAEYSFGVWLNGNELESGRIGKANWCDGRVLSFTDAQLPQATLHLQLMKNSNVPVWLSARETYSFSGSEKASSATKPSRAAVASKGSDISLERQFYRVDGRGHKHLLKADDTLRVGEKIAVVCTLTARRPVRYVVLEDRACACLAMSVGKAGNGATELDGSEVRFYIPEVKTGRTELSWSGKVVDYGRFLAPPARAFQAHSAQDVACSEVGSLNVVAK